MFRTPRAKLGESKLEENNILPFNKAVDGEEKHVDDWLSKIGQEGIILARLKKKYRSARGMTGTLLTQFQIIDREHKMRLLRVTEDHLDKEQLRWVSPVDFCEEWEHVETLDAGKF
jgi:hypothetical protein